MEAVQEHPIAKGYGADAAGNVFNLLNGKILDGSIKGGYGRVTIGGRALARHVFVWACFNGVPQNGHEVHHKNANKLDNCLANLEVLSAAEHRRVTSAARVLSGSSTCFSRRKPVKRVFENGQEEIFDGVEEAAKAAGVCTSAVTQSARSSAKKRYKGAYWEYIVEKDAEGEVWACPRSARYRGLCVSNFGRIRSKKGVVSHGFKIEDGYMKVRVNDRSWGVHSIVNEVFNGFAPELSMTTDHIDRNRSNNCAANLRWSTQHGQSHNSGRASSVTARCVLTGKTESWPSQRMAAEALSIGWSQIGVACSTGQVYKGFVWNK